MEPKTINCTLLDADGRVVRSFFSNAQQSAGHQRRNLDLGGLPAGTYVLRLDDHSGSLGVQVVME